ncbi:unnamed protein product [Brassica oleracea var. botrytis]|uniref:(rape) hypothetical protein n=1 Tax=Brassica napus TaxID=3708 RepID=A0A816PZQ1_BRANA|nr:unnamed protein product [Brassica napus]
MADLKIQAGEHFLLCEEIYWGGQKNRTEPSQTESTEPKPIQTEPKYISNHSVEDFPNSNAEQIRNNMESNHEVYAMLKAAVKFFTQFSPWSSSLLNVFLPLTNRPGVLAGEATATKVTDTKSSNSLLDFNQKMGSSLVSRLSKVLGIPTGLYSNHPTRLFSSLDIFA